MNHLLDFEKVSFDYGASAPKASDEELNSRAPFPPDPA
jgi:hypothetical protein